MQSKTNNLFTLSINYKMKKSLFAFAVALLSLGSCNAPNGENQGSSAGNADNQAAIENIMTRSSIRHFKEQPVEQEKIDIMLKAAMAAPTAVNLQPWHFIVITDKAIMKALSGPSPANAPLLIAVCGNTDKNVLPDGKTKVPDFWVEDASAATENLLLAAHALGLDAPDPEKYFDMMKPGRYIWSPQYTMHKTVMGLVDTYRFTGNKQALDVVNKLADWFIRWIDDMKNKREAAKKDLAMAAASADEALNNIESETGKESV